MFLKSCGVVGLMHFLRGSSDMYYYYKAVKIAYYYKCSESERYLFNVMNRNHAVHIINVVIKEKQWENLVKVETVNALYTLVCKERWWNDDISRLVGVCYQLFAIWSLVCVVKLLHIGVSFMIIIWYLSVWLIKGGRVQDGLLAVILYAMTMLNVNDLIIAVVYSCRHVVYKIYIEFVFFIKHNQDIVKMVDRSTSNNPRDSH